MALAAASVFEIRTAGNDTNGGGFVEGATGTDYSIQDSKNTVGNNISTTDAVSNGTTTITSAGASFTSAIVGNIIYFQGGTGTITAQWRQVTVFTNATTITIDATIATSTGMTMNIGGALASPGQTAAIAVNNSHKVHWKAGTYTVTSASTNISNGCISSANTVRWFGYQTIRGDRGTKPIMKADGVITSFTLVTISSQGAHWDNIEFDGNSRTSSRGFNSASNVNQIARCTFKNFTNNAVAANNRTTLTLCYVTGCSTATAASGGNWFRSIISGNTVTGLAISNSVAEYCILANNTGATSDGLICTSDSYVNNCVSYANGRHGIDGSTANAVRIENCISVGNAGTGINISSVRNISDTNAAYNNGINFSITGTFFNSITLTVDPFINSAGGNFTLNNTVGGGLVCRGVNISTIQSLSGISHLTYESLGAIQPSPSAGFTKIPLSGSTNGKAIKISATSSPGTTIHTSIDGTVYAKDEIYLYATNTSASPVELTIEFGGTTDPDDRIILTIPSKDGLTQILPGHILNNASIVKAFAGTTDVINVIGFVNRII